MGLFSNMFKGKKAVRIPQFKNRGKYNIVSYDQKQIAESSPETRTEDQILNHSNRLKLIDLARNLVRNSSLFNTLLGNLTTRVVSTNGGKVITNFADDELNKRLRKEFSRFTRNADFFTGASFNHLLKRILRETIITGDCVLVFDDGQVEGSGKILFFEAEEIVNVDAPSIERHYGKGCYQIQGKVYSQNGRWIGTTVSRSCRGLEVADASKCYFLKRDPNGLPFESNWYQPEHSWREGRGISQASSAIGTIHSLEDLVTSELLASKRNAQLFCWLVEGNSAQSPMPSSFSEDVSFEGMGDAEIEQSAKQEVDEVVNVNFNVARENSIMYEKLPSGFDAKQLQTQHPNSNVQVMVDFLANRCAATLGLSKSYATGNVTNSDFRANQLYSAGAIVEFQKELEKICDWVFVRFVKWIGIDADDEFMANVSWAWQGIDDLDEVAHQNAISLKFRNCMTTFKDELGSDWKETLAQIKEEIDWCKQNNLPHPSFAMLSGGERSESTSYTTNKEVQQ